MGPVMRVALAAEVTDGDVVGARVITREWDEGVFDRTDLKIVRMGPPHTSRVGRAVRLALDPKTGETVGMILEGEPVVVDDVEQA